MSTFKLNNYITSSKTYTHQSLAGGKYDVPIEEYNELYKYLMKTKKHSICEKLTDVFKLYLDFDGLPTKYDIFDMVRGFRESLGDFLKTGDESIFEEYHILQNQVKTRNFHVYFPNVLVNKTVMRNLCNYMNILFDEDIFDANAYNSCFRMYHTLKYDRKLKKYIKDSNYNFINEPEELSEIGKFQKLCIQTDEEETNVELTDEVINKLKEHKKMKRSNSHHESSNVESATRQIKELITDPLEKQKKEYYLNVIKQNDFQYIKYILHNCFSQMRVDDHSMWAKIAYLLPILNVPKQVVLEWSKTSTHYNGDDTWVESRLDAIYEKDDEITYDSIAASYYTLINFAKEDNFAGFNDYKLGVSEYEKNILVPEVIDNYINNDQRGLCELFSILYSDRVKIVGTSKDIRVYYWNGDLWILDKKNYVQYLFMVQITNNLVSYKKYLSYKMENDIENVGVYEANMKITIGLLKSCNRAKYAKDCIQSNSYLMQQDNFLQKLDSNPDILAVKNGNINLKTGEINPRTIYDYNSFKLDIVYDANIDMTNIERFMYDIMIGQEDIIGFLQKFLGYAITGHITEQNFAVFYGENGSNGKSVLSNLFTKTFGSYSTTLDAEIFSSKKGNAGTATTHLNYIQKKRVGILDESNKKQEFNEGLIKRITGGTKLRIRKLQQESEEIEVKMTPILCTNFKPNFSNDPALHRRMLMIEFEAIFMDIEDDRYDVNNPRHKLIDLDIEDKVSKEEVLSYFVNGAFKWYTEGLRNIPSKIKEYNKEFKNSCNKFTQFLKVYAIVDENETDVFTSFRRLYDAYGTFAHPQKININDFKYLIEKNGYEEIIQDDTSGYEIKLKDEIF